jgi:hypothetical protein
VRTTLVVAVVAEEVLLVLVLVHTLEMVALGKY